MIGPAQLPERRQRPEDRHRLADTAPPTSSIPDGTSCYGDDPTTSNAERARGRLLRGRAPGRPPGAASCRPSGLRSARRRVASLVPHAGDGRDPRLDLALPEYQPPGQDFVGAWDTTTGQFRPGFPPTVNDLQFLTGPAIADIDGLPGEEVVEGTASQDLAAFSAAGTPVPGWPKLSTDWTVAIPLIGVVRDAGHRRGDRQGRDRDDALRANQRLRDRRPGLLARLVAALPPRQRQLGRLLGRDAGPARRDHRPGAERPTAPR